MVWIISVCSTMINLFLAWKIKVYPMMFYFNSLSNKIISINRKSILAIIDTIKLCVRLIIVLRGHRNASKYHPETGHAPTSADVENFVQIINYGVRNGNKVLENHFKTCSKSEIYLSAILSKMIYWNFVIRLLLKVFQKKWKVLKFLL